jgi:hypothetical protein
MAKEKIDYGYNIFENVSKEQFIEEVNSKPLRKKEYSDRPARSLYAEPECITFFEIKVHYLINYLSFKVSRDVKNRIIDIENYEEEIEVFNSFNPIVKVDDRIFILVDNINEYFTLRGKDKMFLYSHSSKFTKCHRANFTAFLNMIKEEEKQKITAEVKIELDKFEQGFITILNECLMDFKDFNGVIKFERHNCRMLFGTYNDYIRINRLTKEHLISNNLFDKFSIHYTKLEHLISYLNRINFKEHPLREYDKELIKTTYENYINCFKTFADYIGYDMEIITDAQHKNISMRTELWITFKKIK